MRRGGGGGGEGDVGGGGGGEGGRRGAEGGEGGRRGQCSTVLGNAVGCVRSRGEVRVGVR